MTSGMKGFMVEAATVACTLLIGFGSGGWVAAWLNEKPHKLTRIEMVKGTTGCWTGTLQALQRGPTLGALEL